MINKNCENVNNCYSCDFCYSCNSCNSCNSCYSCNGLRMSEKMIFCLGEGKYVSNGAGYQKNLQMFNQPITKDEYDTQIKYLRAKDFKLPIAKWIETKDITKEEKSNWTLHKQTGGFLKTLSYQDAWKQMWGEMSTEDRNFFKSLLHFNAEIFEKITGIKVEEEISLKGKKVEVIIDGRTYKATLD